jgi:hypothetical protein
MHGSHNLSDSTPKGPHGPDLHAGSMSSSRRFASRKSTYGSIGGLYRPSYLQAQATKGEQEQEPTALGLLDLLFAQPVVVVVVRRQGLLKERIDFGRHSLGDNGGRVLVDEFYVGVALSVWPSAHERVAAKRNELGSWPRAS